MSAAPVPKPDPEPSPADERARTGTDDADGWALLEALRRRLDDQAALGRKTQGQVGQLAESIAALVAEQRRRSKWLNLNSFVAYVIFTVVVGAGFYALYRSRSNELLEARDTARHERDLAAQRADDATTKVSARERADAVAWDAYQLLEAGKRTEAAAKLAALGTQPLSRTERAVLAARAHETQVMEVEAALKSAVASFKAGRYAEVVGPLEAALVGEPTGARAGAMHYFLGVAYAKGNDLAKATAHLVIANTTDTEHEDVRFQLASALDRSGQYAKARAEYDQFATAHPQSSLAVFAMRRSATLARAPAVSPTAIAPASITPTTTPGIAPPGIAPPGIAPPGIAPTGIAPKTAPTTPGIAPKTAPTTPGIAPTTPGIAPGIAPKTAPGIAPKTAPGITPKTAPGIAPTTAPTTAPGSAPTGSAATAPTGGASTAPTPKAAPAIAPSNAKPPTAPTKTAPAPKPAPVKPTPPAAADAPTAEGSAAVTPMSTTPFDLRDGMSTTGTAPTESPRSPTELPPPPSAGTPAPSMPAMPIERSPAPTPEPPIDREPAPAPRTPPRAETTSPRDAFAFRDLSPVASMSTTSVEKRPIRERPSQTIEDATRDRAPTELPPAPNAGTPAPSLPSMPIERSPAPTHEPPIDREPAPAPRTPPRADTTRPHERF